VVEKATWKDGALRTAVFEPFEILRHSNQESYRKERRRLGQEAIWESGSSGRTRTTTLRLTVAACELLKKPVRGDFAASEVLLITVIFYRGYFDNPFT
jgi:hypothetical protein